MINCTRTLTLILISIVNCVGAELSLKHKIVVPEKYSWGKENYHSTPSIQIYYEAYERAWWTCIKNRAKDIDYSYTSKDILGNGWPVFLEGWNAGYLDADARVVQLIREFGRNQVSEFLKEQSRYYDEAEI